MLYRNIIKPSKHLQGGILTVTYCTFWIDIINKYYTFAQIGLKIKVFMIVMKWPKSSIEYCMECVDLCIQLSIRQSVARCPPERSGGWAPTISPGAQPILPLTSLQFYVATDFTSEWSRTWSQPADSRGRLEFYSGTVMPPPPGHHHRPNQAVGKGSRKNAFLVHTPSSAKSPLLAPSIFL